MTSAADFADALLRLETDRELDPFLAQFSGDVELVRPESGRHEKGADGARRFWQSYLEQFTDITSTFHRLVDADRCSELEWVSTGTLHTGRPITYAGVSLLELDSEGSVRRFATYYDTARFIDEPAATT